MTSLRWMVVVWAVVVVSACGVARGDEVKAGKLVLAFYYPWYGTPEGTGGKAHGGRYVHWEGVEGEKKRIGSSTNYPVGGAYDSQDRGVIARHCEAAKGAGIDGFVISWWGKGTFEDEAVGTILDECGKHGMKACIYYETVAPPRSVESAAGEVWDLVDRYGTHPAYLKVKREGGGEGPVVFVYGRALGELGPEKWKGVVETLRGVATEHKTGAPIIIGDSFDKRFVEVFDGAHSYGPAGDLNAALKKGETAESWAKRAMAWWAGCGEGGKPKHADKIACATVFPGYDDTKIRKPGMKVEREGGKLYRMLWREAAAAKPDWILITSFNEWHEGSEIEASEELGSKYLEMTLDGAKAWKAK